LPPELLLLAEIHVCTKSFVGLGGGAARERKGRRGGEKEEGTVGEGVPECPNSELASLMASKDYMFISHCFCMINK